jgi:acetyl-CoA decarbonylase/synthase complex subunit beta
MRSKKFFAADGGWNRIVWVPKEVKEKVKNSSADVVDKVATEEDAKTIDELKAFLRQRTTQS